jgi:hypothetical protein
VVGNARFLILPHVRVPHLASAVLGAVTRRLPIDWQVAYGYPPVLAETFVQSDRFAGTGYRAANWTQVGRTTGRGKLDRHHEHLLPVKDVYLYPLHLPSAPTLCTAPGGPSPPARPEPTTHGATLDRPAWARELRILTLSYQLAYRLNQVG